MGLMALGVLLKDQKLYFWGVWGGLQRSASISSSSRLLSCSAVLYSYVFVFSHVFSCFCILFACLQVNEEYGEMVSYELFYVPDVTSCVDLAQDFIGWVQNEVRLCAVAASCVVCSLYGDLWKVRGGWQMLHWCS